MKQAPVRPIVWLALLIVLLASSALGCAVREATGGTGPVDDQRAFEVKNVPDVRKGTFRVLFDDSGQIARLELPVGTVIKKQGRLPENPIRARAILNATSIEILSLEGDPCIKTGYGAYKCW
jgi:hypothetical protein